MTSQRSSTYKIERSFVGRSGRFHLDSLATIWLLGGNPSAEAEGARLTLDVIASCFRAAAFVAACAHFGAAIRREPVQSRLSMGLVWDLAAHSSWKSGSGTRSATSIWAFWRRPE
jgi:hypothetical protein